MFVRDGKRLPIREYDDVHVRAGEISLDDLLKHATEDGQILCSYNATRKRINAKVRKALGYEGDMPQVGEKIVCKFNQHGYGFMNGEQGILLSYESVPDYEREDDDEHGLMVRIKSLTDGKERTVKFNPLSFDRDEEVAKTAQKTTGGFDYGWCLTIHSAQGSEWPRVLVIEELMRGANYAKTMYTGITRAQEELTIYREG
jgi:exodeoxyribonuclease-5